MLYKRDYRILTDEEQTLFNKVEARYIKARQKGDGGISLFNLNRYWEDMPKAARYYKTLFPNNYLNIRELYDTSRLKNVNEQFNELLNQEITERDIIRFIKENEAYFIIGTVLQQYDFGHHAAFLFKEFELPPNFIADYLLVGKNSGGYEFVFVELENIYGNITTGKGELGLTTRKGIQQVEEWDSWLDGNFSHLKLQFEKHLGINQLLTNEFLTLDKTRIHYAVISGRRKDYQAKTYTIRRRLKIKNNITLLHYDNLVDGVESLSITKNYA